MLNRLLILGICAGSAASVPILYQASPDTFGWLLQRAAQTEAATEIRVLTVEPKRGTRQSGRQFRVEADASGHFIGAFTFNGRRVEAMVDTGATLVAINMSTARRIGVKVSNGDFGLDVKTANGTVKAARATIGTMGIGRIRLRDVPALVLADSALDGTLVGMSFLQRLSGFKVEDNALLLSE